jgi:hypothetical protein
MRNKLRTPEIDRMIDNEAYRRFRGDHIDARTPTKIIARQTGITYGYLANLIAAKRREYEQKVNVSRETTANVNLPASE